MVKARPPDRMPARYERLHLVEELVAVPLSALYPGHQIHLGAILDFDIPIVTINLIVDRQGNPLIEMDLQPGVARKELAHEFA